SVIITFSGASTTVCYLSCSFALFFSLLLLPRPPRSPLFPYTTLFRSDVAFKVSAVFIRSHYAFKRVHYFSLVTIVMRRMIDGILDRKSTRLNSSHVSISYAVFCLKKKIIIYKLGFNTAGILPTIYQYS